MVKRGSNPIQRFESKTSHIQFTTERLKRMPRGSRGPKHTWPLWPDLFQVLTPIPSGFIERGDSCALCLQFQKRWESLIRQAPSSDSFPALRANPVSKASFTLAIACSSACVNIGQRLSPWCNAGFRPNHLLAKSRGPLESLFIPHTW